MNYLIIEAYTDANIGSGALVENSVKLLTESLKVPKSNIRIMAHYPSVFEEKYNIKSVPDIFKFPFNQKRLKQIVWLFKTTCWMLISWVFSSMSLKSKRWSDYRWADVVISVGAERINDKYIKNELFSLFTYAIVKKFGKKMVLFPSTYGPFLYKFTYELSKKVFSSLDIIYARDEKSYNTLKSFNIDESKIINTSDVAIFQEWDTCFMKYSFDNNLPTVGVSVLKWTYVANKYETPYSNYDSYVREISAFIDSIISKYNVNVVLFPTNFPINGCREDDVIVAKEVYGRCMNSDRIKIIDELPSALEFKSLLARSTVNVTTRMHACILSTSAFVPTMSINYLFKLKEYMDSLGMSRYSIDIEDFNAKDSLSMFDELWNNREVEKTNLRNVIQKKKEQLACSMLKMKEL